MIIIPCPNCKIKVTIDISKAIDEQAEVYKCPNCGLEFRYAQ